MRRVDKALACVQFDGARRPAPGKLFEPQPFPHGHPTLHLHPLRKVQSTGVLDDRGKVMLHQLVFGVAERQRNRHPLLGTLQGSRRHGCRPRIQLGPIEARAPELHAAEVPGYDKHRPFQTMAPHEFKQRPAGGASRFARV